MAIPDRKDLLSEIESYELIHFNLDRFVSHRQLEYDAFGQKYKVQLLPNENMIDSEIRSSVNGEHTTSTNTVSCHYFGTVLEPQQSAHSSYLSLSLCPNRGIRGSVTSNNASMWIMPSAYYFDMEYDRKGLHRFTDTHLVYLTSAASAGDSNKAQDVARDSSRHLLGYNDNNIVELYLLSDPGLTMRYRDEYGENGYVNQLKYYVMDLINGASAEYQEANWGSAGKIQLAIAELEIARDFTGVYSALYPSFSPNSPCQDWKNYKECELVGQAKTAEVAEKHGIITKFRAWVSQYRSSKKYDHYHELTGYRLLGINGVAYSGGMCRSDWNMGVSKLGHNNVHYTTGTLAHEIGHQLGMNHNTCSNCIMGPYSAGDYKFNDQSIRDTRTRFTQHNKLSCLRDGKRSMKVTVQSGGGGTSSYGSDSNSGDSTSSGTCATNPSKSTCSAQCQTIVSSQDSWCGNNAWDKSCQSIAKSKCTNGGSSSSSSSSGICCICTNSGNPSKSTCGASCQNAVSSQDKYCGNNAWDKTCISIAKSKCNGGFNMDCVESTAYDDVVCVYNDGFLWTQHQEFAYSDCVESNPSYQYRMDANASYLLYYNEYYEYVDSVKKSGKWVVAQDDGVLTEVAECDEVDLMKCGVGNWKILSDVDDDSLQLIVDETMRVKNGRCHSSQEHSINSSTDFVFVAIGAVLFVVILAICVFFVYQRSKRLKMKKSVDYIGDDSEDEEEEEEEAVEVALEQTNLTVTSA
eukprot:545578_1